MTNSENYHIFISYSTDNSKIKNEVVKDLTDYGFDVWVDTKSIALTRNWTEEIKKGISNSKILLYLGSQEAKKSTYVSYELGYADALNKIILPIRIKGLTWEECVPSWYSVTQGMELRGSQYEKRKTEFFSEICDLLSNAIMEKLRRENLIQEDSQLKNILREFDNVAAHDNDEYSEKLKFPLIRAGIYNGKPITIDMILNILIDWKLLKFEREFQHREGIEDIDFFYSILTPIGRKIAGL